MDSKEPTTADMKKWHENMEAGVGDWYDLAGILIERLEAAEATNEALTRELGKTITAADKLEQGIQKYLDGDEPKQLSSKFAGCIHRNLNYQGCGLCIENYFSGLLHGARLMDSEAVPAVKESLTTENKEPTTAEIQSDVSRWVAENITDPFHDEDIPKILVYAVMLLKRLEAAEKLSNVVTASQKISIARADEQAVREENAGLLLAIKDLTSALTAAEELNDDQAHRLGKAKATIKAFEDYKNRVKNEIPSGNHVSTK